MTQAVGHQPLIRDVEQANGDRVCGWQANEREGCLSILCKRVACVSWNVFAAGLGAGCSTWLGCSSIWAGAKLMEVGSNFLSEASKDDFFNGFIGAIPSVGFILAGSTLAVAGPVVCYQGLAYTFHLIKSGEINRCEGD